MNIEYQETREKRESVLLAEFDIQLQKLAGNDWNEGVRGLLQLLTHPLIVQRPHEYKDFKRSVYYNLAMIFREKMDYTKAMYFYFCCYKINPEDVNIIADLALLCRKEALADQALYFFEQAYQREQSSAMKMIYLEQTTLLLFVLDQHQEVVSRAEKLIRCGFKQNDLMDLIEASRLEMRGPCAEENDFFSTNFVWDKTSTSSFSIASLMNLTLSQLCAQNPYIKRVVELRSEYQRKKVERVATSNHSLLSEKATKPQTIPIQLTKPKWRDLLSSIIVALRIHGLRVRSASASEIRSKVEIIPGYKTIGTIDLDITKNTFQVEYVSTETNRLSNMIIPKPSSFEKRGSTLGQPMSIEETLSAPKERPREERYGGGQMSLRADKKSNNKVNTSIVNQLPFAKPDSGADQQPGFDGVINRLLRVHLDGTENAFFASECASIVGTEDEMRSRAIALFDEGGEDASTVSGQNNQGHFLNLVSSDIENLEERDFVDFYQEKLEGQVHGFNLLVTLIFEHLLSVKKRVYDPFGFRLDEKILEGPSPLLFFTEFQRYFINHLNLECLLTLFELLGQTITKTIRLIGLKDENEQIALRESLKAKESQWRQMQGQLIAKLAGYCDPGAHGVAPPKIHMLNLIRFQIQMLNLPASFMAEGLCPEMAADAGTDRIKLYNDYLSTTLALNLVKFFKLDDKEKDQAFGILQTQLNLESQNSLHDTASYYGRPLDLYWLEMTSLTANQVYSSKNKSASTLNRQMNMATVLNLHYMKSIFKEYADFTENFSTFYERYFFTDENSADDKIQDFFSNTSRFFQLFFKGFVLPGRLGGNGSLEDAKSMFMTQFKCFKLSVIIPRITKILRRLIENGVTLEIKEQALSSTLVGDTAVLLSNSVKFVVFVLLAADSDQINLTDLIRFPLYLSKAVSVSPLPTFKLSRLLHIIMHKSLGLGLKAHQACSEPDIRILMASVAVSCLRMNLVPVGQAEREMVQIFRCMFLRVLEASAYEHNKHVPDYSPLAALETMLQSEAAEKSVSPTEIQLLIEMLSHFFFAKLELSVGENILERLDQVNKPQKQQSVNVNKKQLLELNLPTKLKKSIQRILQVCFEEMKKKENKKLWFISAEAQILKRQLPSILDYIGKLNESATNSPARIQNELEVDITASEITKKFKKAVGLDSINIQDHNVELILNILGPCTDREQALSHIKEYFECGGDRIEVDRLMKFFQIMRKVRSGLHNKNVKPEKVEYNLNGAAILLTLFMYLHDQDNSGRLLSEHPNISCDTDEKISEISEELTLYEHVGVYSVIYTGLMDCPVWFFYNCLSLVRLMLDEYTLEQSLSVSSFFLKECAQRKSKIESLKKMENSDARCLIFIKSVLEYFLPKVGYSQIIPEFFKAEESQVNSERVFEAIGHRTSLQKAADKVMLETVMVSDLFEYYLIVTVMQWEAAIFDKNLIGMVESCVASCHSVHNDFGFFVKKNIMKLGAMFNSSEVPRDDIGINYESKYAQYKNATKEVKKTVEMSKQKVMEQFDFILYSEAAATFRLDYLVVMYECRINEWNTCKNRIHNIFQRFKRLDQIQERTPSAFLYLNTFQVSIPNSMTSQEVEVLKNEYFLRTIRMLLRSLFAMASPELKLHIATKLTGETDGFQIREQAQDKPFEQIRFDTLLDDLEEVFRYLKSLVDVSPTPFESFNNFGIEQDRLFTISNFLQTLFHSCVTDDSQKLSELHQQSKDFVSTLRIKEDIGNLQSRESLTRRVTLVVEEIFDVVRKSLLSLYGVTERYKTRFKDSHFTLRCSFVLRDYVEHYFGNDRSRSMTEKLTDYLCDDYFSKNLDINIKFELDLRLGYLLNCSAYKNNLRYEAFEFLSLHELENIKTFKKAERIAFKENNPLYLALSLRSMDMNLRDLFRKVFKAFAREIDIVMSKDFGSNIQDLSTFVNDNEEYNFFTNDKKQYDAKALKSVITFARGSGKTDIFNLLSSYIFEIYNAISHSYCFGRNKKQQLARRFCEASLAIDAEKTQKLNALVEEVPAGREAVMENIKVTIKALQDIHDETECKTICQEFSKDYLASLNDLMKIILTDECINVDPTANIQPLSASKPVAKPNLNKQVGVTLPTGSFGHQASNVAPKQRKPLLNPSTAVVQGVPTLSSLML